MTDTNPNFGSPDFEPTDDQLRDLSREAFGDVGAKYRAALEALMRQVDRLRTESLERIAAVTPEDATG